MEIFAQWQEKCYDEAMIYIVDKGSVPQMFIKFVKPQNISTATISTATEHDSSVTHGHSKKNILIVLTSAVLILFLILILLYLYLELFVYPREFIKVNYIASYDIDMEVDYMYFYGYYAVGDVKERMEYEYWKDNFGELEGLREELDKLDDNTRMVISLGSGIQYFWIPKDKYDYDGFIRVKYKRKEPENKIYFYTTDYMGLIVDATNV